MCDQQVKFIPAYLLTLSQIVISFFGFFYEPIFPHSLEELQESVQVAVKGLTGPIVKEDHQGFLDIMSLLLAVRARIGAIDRVFESLRGTIVLLEHCDVKIPEYCYTQMEVCAYIKLFI